MLEVELENSSKYILIDDEDFEKIREGKLYLAKRKSGDHISLYLNEKNYILARFILNAPVDLHVDHIDHDLFNNQKANLRLCKQIQNNWNKGKYVNNTSGYKGVFWSKQSNKWKAQIRYCSKFYYLGSFTDKIEAAKAYDEAAKKYFGEFANLNFKD